MTIFIFVFSTVTKVSSSLQTFVASVVLYASALQDYFFLKEQAYSYVTISPVSKNIDDDKHHIHIFLSAYILILAAAVF